MSVVNRFQFRGAKSKSAENGGTKQLRTLPEHTAEVRPWRVIFQTLTSEARVLGVDVFSVAIIGRSDPSTNIKPDLDLAVCSAKDDHGISRQHAILLPTDEGLSLIDLDSTNGTWINGLFLQPGKRYRLRSGDRVEFGKLRLIVRVVGAMSVGRPNDATSVVRAKPGQR
jgi:pSer/pThr/pTyr-binding forkhead associated (FHA) protein